MYIRVERREERVEGVKMTARAQPCTAGRPSAPPPLPTTHILLPRCSDMYECKRLGNRQKPTLPFSFLSPNRNQILSNKIIDIH